MPGGSPVPNRYIKSELKSHRLLWEEERPIRWPYMKILREYSTLKEFYPEINPYVEAYRMRENVWALFQESMDGAGDLWMYVINGPERVLLIDTGFGVGDLKGLVQHLWAAIRKSLWPTPITTTITPMEMLSLPAATAIRTKNSPCDGP